MPALLLLAFLPLVMSQGGILVLKPPPSTCASKVEVTSSPTDGTDVASSFATLTSPVSLGFMLLYGKLGVGNTISSLSVRIFNSTGPPSPDARPGAEMISTNLSLSEPINAEVDIFNATFVSPLQLNASSTYWVVVNTSAGLPTSNNLCGTTIPLTFAGSGAEYGQFRYVRRTSNPISAWTASPDNWMLSFSLFNASVEPPLSPSSSLSPTTSPTATPSFSSSPSPTPSPTPSLTPSSTGTPSNSVTTGLTPSQSPTGTSSMTPTMTPSLTVNFTFSNSPSASHSSGASHTGPEGGCPEGEEIDEGRCLPIPRPPTVSASSASLDAGAVIAIILTLLIVGGIVACCISPSFLAHFARFFLGCRRCLCNSESSAYPPEPVNNFNVKNPLVAKV